MAKVYKKAKRVKLSTEEIQKRDHIKSVRKIFSDSGFATVSGVRDKEFTFMGRAGDIDDVFVYENIILLAEYTSTKSNNVSDHLLNEENNF